MNLSVAQSLSAIPPDSKLSRLEGASAVVAGLLAVECNSLESLLKRLQTRSISTCDPPENETFGVVRRCLVSKPPNRTELTGGIQSRDWISIWI